MDPAMAETNGALCTSRVQAEESTAHIRQAHLPLATVWKPSQSNTLSLKGGFFFLPMFPEILFGILPGNAGVMAELS